MWVPLVGTAFVCSLMGYTSYLMFYKCDQLIVACVCCALTSRGAHCGHCCLTACRADKEERQHHEEMRRRAGWHLLHLAALATRHG